MSETTPARVLRGKVHAKGVAAGKVIETVNSYSGDEFFTKFLTDSTKSALITSARERELELECTVSDELADVDLDECLKLIEDSSKNDYASSEIKWKPAAKRKEMRLPDMKYMILRHGCNVGQAERNRCAGFLSFMATYEDGLEVIYVYELHLNPSVQGKGLGKLLMNAAEDIGHKIELEKIMLTVFKSNIHAEAWYRRLGYGVDEFSPGPRRLRNGTVKEPSYLILSKMPR